MYRETHTFQAKTEIITLFDSFDVKLLTHKKGRGKGKVQGVPQSQTVAPPRHQEEEGTDKTKKRTDDGRRRKEGDHNCSP